MVKRAKLVNDIVELIPIFQLLSTEMHRKVYSALLDEWLTLEELKSRFGDGFEETLKILKHAGMLEVKWRMPSDPGGKPEKEYHVSYTHISANFYVSLKDFNRILEIVFMPDDEVEKHVERIIKEVQMGRNSVGHIMKVLNYDPLFIRAIVKRTLKLNLKGQLIELAKNEEI
ncbi:MAG: ArsR family transcriptional regulator [Archaeoglobi archaeon]|jgi:predicted DNA-binding ArsR family transcriptional regulator|nr:ArsR family transcriptional regulator [Archaeoglobus sp.]NHW89205.1 ArsR family transcriptional regulator [Archaeoglobales archaeon]TDA26269.1 MAG: ArsR family transcriptional regulator [Archaeoglobi archaeon]